MKRYSQDYGIEFHSPTNRRPLARAEAARVIAEPLPERTSGHGKAIARHMPGGRLHAVVWLTVLACWALAWLVAFAS